MLILFEIQQPVTENSETSESFSNFGLHRAQVFANHDHALADAFQGDNANQVVPVVAYVGAGGSIGLIGDPVQPEKPHDMIDAQRSTVPAILANGLDEEPVSR